MSNFDIIIEELNDVHIRAVADASIIQELRDYFTFKVEGAKFSPAYKNGMWDGNITLMSARGTIYCGLLTHIETFARNREYTFLDTTSKVTPCDDDDIEGFITRLNLDESFTPRDYQKMALKVAVNNHRSLLVSPTASGKSLIIHMIMKWRQMVDRDMSRVLLVVPKISLVRQMMGDLIEYGEDPDSIQMIMGGETKIVAPTTRIVISTWQSLVPLKKPWFEQFNTFIGDEAHTFKAKSLIGIMEKLTKCEYKIGTTGTLDGTKVNKLVLEGLFGPSFQVERTENLMKVGRLSTLKIRCVVLQYSDEERKIVSKMKYEDEVDWIVRNQKRVNFVRDFALSLDGNTLVMFQFVEKHGEVLYKAICEQAEEGRKVYYVHGGVSGIEREEIRKSIEHETNAIIVCSFGTFSTGINIKNLHNAISASPTKSMIRILQSIGRILRTSLGKEEAFWFDIADDLSWKSKSNYTIQHFSERMKIYASEKFDYKVFTRRL